MHAFNLKIIKLSLVVIMAAVVSGMVNGISVLRNNYYWRTEYFQMEYAYWKNRMEYNVYANDGYGNWLKNSISSKATPSAKTANTHSVPILLYHGVIADQNWQPDEVNIRVEDFRKQMFDLKKAGWQTVRLEDYQAFIRGERDLPEKSFLITFDDGRSDSYYPVDPILRSLDYEAVMYVITNRMFEDIGEQGEFHLSEKEYSQMIASGRWQIESHGRDDHDLIPTGPDGQTGRFLSNHMWLSAENRFETDAEYRQRILADLSGSKSDIENRLGVHAVAFAYPFGDLGQTTVDFPESHGEVIDSARLAYELSFCQAASGDYPTNYAEGSFLAKRIVVNSFMSADELLHIFENSTDKAIDYVDDFTENKGWISGWGNMAINNGSLIISNTAADRSALAFLNGAYLWRNFLATATVRIDGNGKASMAARYHDANNYVSCDYSDDNVILTQKMNRQAMFEKAAAMQTGLTSGQELEIGVRVQENNIACLINGQEVVSGTIDQNLKNGGIAFKVWNAAEGNTTLTVKDLAVRSLPAAETAIIQQ